MAKINVHWRHEPFSHDAGMRSTEDSARTNTAAARTGILTDEHQEVVDDRPVLLEDASERVYRSADLPPGTVVYISELPNALPDIARNAQRAGFTLARADTGEMIEVGTG